MYTVCSVHIVNMMLKIHSLSWVLFIYTSYHIHQTHRQHLNAYSYHAHTVQSWKCNHVVYFKLRLFIRLRKCQVKFIRITLKRAHFACVLWNDASVPLWLLLALANVFVFLSFSSLGFFCYNYNNNGSAFRWALIHRLSLLLLYFAFLRAAVQQ